MYLIGTFCIVNANVLTLYELCILFNRNILYCKLGIDKCSSALGNHLIGTFCIVNEFQGLRVDTEDGNLIGTFCIVNY